MASATQVSRGARLCNTYLADPDKNMLPGGKRWREKKTLSLQASHCGLFASGWMLTKLLGLLYPPSPHPQTPGSCSGFMDLNRDFTLHFLHVLCTLAGFYLLFLHPKNGYIGQTYNSGEKRSKMVVSKQNTSSSHMTVILIKCVGITSSVEVEFYCLKPNQVKKGTS